YFPESGSLYIPSEAKGAKGKSVSIPLSALADSILQDRIKNNKVKIIDYKTGSTSQMEKHKKQVDGYYKALKKMGFEEISKYIIYTEENDKIVQW
ncbi:MAG: hypothetical protein ACPHL8_02965, partial [Flavobacteriales bacterium]